MPLHIYTPTTFAHTHLHALRTHTHTHWEEEASAKALNVLDIEGRTKASGVSRASCRSLPRSPRPTACHLLLASTRHLAVCTTSRVYTLRTTHPLPRCLLSMPTLVINLRDIPHVPDAVGTVDPAPYASGKSLWRRARGVAACRLLAFCLATCPFAYSAPFGVLPRALRGHDMPRFAVTPPRSVLLLDATPYEHNHGTGRRTCLQDVQNEHDWTSTPSL